MDINLMRSLVTVAAFCCFIAIALWAYSKSARAGFEEAAMLPFEDDEDSVQAPEAGSHIGGKAS